MGNTAASQYCVDVVESGAPASWHWIRCEIGKDLLFDTNKLQTYCLTKWDERLYDLLVVAASVQFCDRTKARPSTGRGRNFVVRVPVHDPGHWRSNTLIALENALSFLTGDQWCFEFVARKAPASWQGNFDMPVENAYAVIPYSDGLDSRAVAGLMKREYACNVLRVRLGSESLYDGHIGDSSLPFASVPFRVRCESRRSVESSVRSRGFKFAALSGIAAYLSGAKTVIMPESGQGALGPCLVPVGQAYEDYRNHPLFTDRMTVFLSALLGYEVCFTYPRLWHTKAETLAEFVTKCPNIPNWAQTRSCWQNQRHVSVSGKMRQCGICAACMLRRMSVHAAGLTECGQSYVWEDLTAARYEDGAAASYRNREPKGAMYKYAIAGALHLDHLASVLQSPANQPGLSRQVFGLSRSLGLTEEDVRTKLYRLIRQHEEEWRNFVDSLGPKSFVAQWVRRGEGHV